MHPLNATEQKYYTLDHYKNFISVEIGIQDEF